MTFQGAGGRGGRRGGGLKSLVSADFSNKADKHISRQNIELISRNVCSGALT